MLNRTMPYVFWTSSIKNNYCNCSRKQLLQGCKIWVQGWNKFWQHLVPFVLAKLFIIAQWTLRFYHLFLVTGKGTINVLASPPPLKKKKEKRTCSIASLFNAFDIFVRMSRHFLKHPKQLHKSLSFFVIYMLETVLKIKFVNSLPSPLRVQPGRIKTTSFWWVHNPFVLKLKIQHLVSILRLHTVI